MQNENMLNNQRSLVDEFNTLPFQELHVPDNIQSRMLEMLKQLDTIQCQSKKVSYLPRVQMFYIRFYFPKGIDLLISFDFDTLREHTPRVPFNIARQGKRIMTDDLLFPELLSSAKGLNELILKGDLND